MTSGLSKILVGVGFLFVTALGACGDDDTNGVQSCTTDNQCSSGLICDNGACQQLTCQSNGDCLNGNQACIDSSAGRICEATECGCANCPQCPLGEVCSNGTCGTAVGCSTAQPCAGSDICEGGTCRACVGAECPTTNDCSVTGCKAEEQCNPTTKQCEAVTAIANACDVCTQDSECGTGWKCAPLPSGKACLPPCSTADQCDTGWTCQAGNCTPQSFRCEGCVTSGCGPSEACNPNSSSCQAATALCASCGNDWECGDGNACRNGVCAARCNNGTCATGGACGPTAGGVQVCQTACEAQCTPACGGATPICAGGRCVQCEDAGDCGAGQTCDAGSNLCVGGGSCSGATPILFEGACVQCTGNQHCSTGESCSAANQCVSGDCAGCAAPYPACVPIGEDSYCVQCAVDADCGLGGVCNTASYACEGGTTTPQESCTTDADCDPGASTFTLTCDRATGYCISSDGMCDNVTAFCVGSDGKVEDCLSIFELFGGGAGGLPPELSGGDTIPGFCGCSASASAPLGNCRNGGLCLDFAAFLALLGGGSSTPGAGTPSAMCLGL